MYHKAPALGVFVHLETITKENLMDPKERLLGMGKLYLKRGEPIPITLLAEAEEQGLSLAEFGLPTNAVDDDGDIITEKETQFNVE